MIEIRQLIYLDAVYRHKSFTKASKALYVSQPTVSTSVRAVEQELGLTLVERTPNGVVFTAEGEALMYRIRQLLSDYRDIMAQASELNHKANYTLRLGIASILSSDIFPLIYKDFLASHRDLTIQLDEDSALGHVQKLLNEELDLAFNGLPEDLDCNEFRTIPVCRREIKLILHRDHPLARLDTVPLERLNGENISILSSPGVMERVLEQAFAQRGVQPNVVSEHSQIHSMLEIVMTCCSMGFVNLSPETVSMNKYEELELRSFQEPLSFIVGFIMKRRKYIPPVCQQFIRFISENLGDEAAEGPGRDAPNNP